MLPDWYKTEAEFSRVEDLLWYGCRRLMKEGGGAIRAEAKNKQKEFVRINPETRQKVADLAKGGTLCIKEIAQLAGLTTTTTRNLLFRLGLKCPDGRSKRRAA